MAAFTQRGSASLLPHPSFYLDVMNGAAVAASARGYEIILVPYGADTQRGSALAIDGAIIVDPHGEEDFYNELRRRGTPVVTLGKPTLREAEFPCVDNDYRAITSQMLDHFEDMGYKRPALLATSRTRSYVADVVESYRSWVDRRGSTPIVVELPEPPDARLAGRAVRELLNSADPPDAIHTTFGQLALGVLREVREAALLIPGDVGVASAVDGETLSWVEPQITSVNLQPFEMGGTAAERLIDCIEGRPVPALTVVESQLLVRASTMRSTGPLEA